MQDHPFLLSFRSRIAYFLIWLVIALAWVLFEAINYHASIVIALTDSLILNGFFSFLALGLYYTVKFGNIEQKNLFNLMLQHLAGLVISVGIWLLACYFMVLLIDNKDLGYAKFFAYTLPVRVAAGVFYYGIVVLLYYLIIYYQNFRETATREAELKALVREAELSVLRSQIKPHFLFNSLNSISSLTLTNPDAAREMIIKLSEFLRYSLGESERNLVPLKAELDFIKLYLDIEKIRFGEKLNYQWNIPEGCSEARLPNMILQPLYENAIKHGIYESTETISIKTTCTIDNGEFVITIRNNFDPENVFRKGKGLGLENIRKRLRLIYSRDDLLTVTRVGNLFTVVLKIPQTIN